MKFKKNCNSTKTNDNAPVDLMRLSRFELVDLACNLRRRAQLQLLKELHELEGSERKEAKKHD